MYPGEMSDFDYLKASPQHLLKLIINPSFFFSTAWLFDKLMIMVHNIIIDITTHGLDPEYWELCSGNHMWAHNYARSLQQ